MFNGVISISPKYQVRHFTDLDLKLDSEAHIWDQAINIFVDRIENRFVIIIQDLLGKVRTDYGVIDYSFSVMALNCLLIETLRQFKLGEDATVGNNEKAFVGFFKSSRFFNECISNKNAKLFYNHIRCGILHQAQTKYNSQLAINQEVMIERLEDDSQCIRVDVEHFTNALIQDYEEYLRNIRNIDYSPVLRQNFISKMNYIVQDISA